MSHSFFKLWVHIVFSTQARLPLLGGTIKEEITEQITKLIKENGSRVLAINLMPDHVHILMSLDPRYALSTVVKNLKGNSSHWINQNDFFEFKFTWQTGYAAFSVSETNLKRVISYIRNQERHHNIVEFEKEIEKLMKEFQEDISSPHD